MKLRTVALIVGLSLPFGCVSAQTGTAGHRAQRIQSSRPQQVASAGIFMEKSKSGSPYKCTLVVASLIENGPADRAGIRPGDTIYSFDGETLANYDDFLIALKASTVGATVKIGYLRQAQRSEAIVTLVERERLVWDWFVKRDNGDAEAETTVGKIYLNGEDVAQSDADAVFWFRKAAGQGNPTAQFYLGVAYYTGKGVEQNPFEAMVWLRKAADQGLAAAEDNVGIMYANGVGVAADLQQARAWYAKAAQQGDAYAKAALAELDAGEIVAAQTQYKADEQGVCLRYIEHSTGVVYSAEVAMPTPQVDCYDHITYTHVTLTTPTYRGPAVRGIVLHDNRPASCGSGGCGMILAVQGCPDFPGEVTNGCINFWGQGIATSGSDMEISTADHGGWYDVAVTGRSYPATGSGSSAVKKRIYKYEGRGTYEDVALIANREKRLVDEERGRRSLALSLGLHSGQPQAEVKAILAAHGYHGMTESGPWTCVPNGVVNGEDTVGCISRSNQVVKLVVVFTLGKIYRDPDTAELHRVRTDHLIYAYFQFANYEYPNNLLTLKSPELQKCDGRKDSDGGCLNF
jgi:hypothetical protein